MYSIEDLARLLERAPWMAGLSVHQMVLMRQRIEGISQQEAIQREYIDGAKLLGINLDEQAS